MPIYVYRLTESAEGDDRGCSLCSDGFEKKQSMSDDALAECPECGAPIERIITNVNVSTRQSTKSILSNQNLKNHGFTKLVREDKGVYRKDV